MRGCIMWKSVFLACGIALCASAASGAPFAPNEAVRVSEGVSANGEYVQEARTRVRSHYRRTKSGYKTRVRSHYRR